MTLADALLVLLPVLGSFGTGYIGFRVGAWVVRRTLKDLALDVAAVEERLLNEAKRRGALKRWEKEEEAAEAAATPDALRDVVIGAIEGDGFIRGKEGGVYGTRAR